MDWDFQATGVFFFFFLLFLYSVVDLLFPRFHFSPVKLLVGYRIGSLPIHAFIHTFRLFGVFSAIGTQE